MENKLAQNFKFFGLIKFALPTMIMLFFVSIVNADNRARKGGYFSEGDEERLVDLPLWVEERADEEQCDACE